MQRITSVRTGFLSGLMLLASVATAVEVENAWIREAPPGAQMVGGFMVVSNPSDTDIVLVGAKGARFADIMLHRTIEEGGVARMVHQMAITIPAHGQVEFKPGDYHLMITAPAQPLKAGDRATITLQFKDGTEKAVEFVVRPGTMGGAMEGHHNMEGMGH